MIDVTEVSGIIFETDWIFFPESPTGNSGLRVLQNKYLRIMKLASSLMFSNFAISITVFPVTQTQKD